MTTRPSKLRRRWRGITIRAVIEHVVRQIAMGRKSPADDDIMRVGANDAGVGADGTALIDP
ncbi:MAG: hypothetical protein ACKVS5_10265 [Parvularculaceae bacterium]